MKTKFIRVLTISLILVLLITSLFVFGVSARVVERTSTITIRPSSQSGVSYHFGFDNNKQLISGEYYFSDVIGRYNIDVSFIQDYIDNSPYTFNVYRYFPIVINIQSPIGFNYVIDEVYYNGENDSLMAIVPSSDSLVIFFSDDFILDYPISFTLRTESDGDGTYLLYLMIPLDSVGMHDFIPYEYNDILDVYEFVAFEDGYTMGFDEGYSGGYNDGYSDGGDIGYENGYADGLSDSSDNFAQSFYFMIYESLGDILYSGNSTTHSDLVLTLLTSLVLLFILIIPILLLIFLFKLVFI